MYNLFEYLCLLPAAVLSLTKLYLKFVHPFLINILKMLQVII
jgi:hypothetical protein